MSAAIFLSVPNHHPASLMKQSSTSISGASSVSSLNSYPYSTVEDSPDNNTALVVSDQPAVSSSNSIASSRDAYAAYASSSAPQTQPALPIVPVCQQITPYNYKPPSPAPAKKVPRAVQPQLIATISVGFEKGDYLIREEKGNNVYFDFLEEGYNFIVQKGYSRMPKYEEDDYMELIKRAQRSVPGGCRFNPGKLLMVLKKQLVPVIAENAEESMGFDSSESNMRKRNSKPKHLSNSSTTLPTVTSELPTDDDDTFASSESCSYDERQRSKSSTYEQSSCSTSYADSWE